jgi:hypothetical protein
MKTYILISCLLLAACKDKSDGIAPPPSVSVPVNNLNGESVKPQRELSFSGPHLEDVREGQWVFIQPWTMWVTANGQYFINGGHNYYTEYQPDFIKVARYGTSWRVSLTGTKFQWTPIEVGADQSLYGSTPYMTVISIQP